MQHIDNIISYINTIIKNGFAYTSADGSVYLDSEKLGKPWTHMLRPKTGVDTEDSGDLGMLGKKRPVDFDVWKSVASQQRKVGALPFFLLLSLC